MRDQSVAESVASLLRLDLDLSHGVLPGGSLGRRDGDVQLSVAGVMTHQPEQPGVDRRRFERDRRVAGCVRDCRRIDDGTRADDPRRLTVGYDHRELMNVASAAAWQVPGIKPDDVNRRDVRSRVVSKDRHTLPVTNRAGRRRHDPKIVQLLPMIDLLHSAIRRHAGGHD